MKNIIDFSCEDSCRVPYENQYENPDITEAAEGAFTEISCAFNGRNK